MRLWHKDIIRFLPKVQLVSQWKELESVFKNQNKHILINYIYDYPKSYLYTYSQLVIDEFSRRGYEIKRWDNYNTYFEDCHEVNYDLSFDEQDDEYFEICYWNLKEKYIRGQKEFSKEEWDRIENYRRKRNENRNKF